MKDKFPDFFHVGLPKTGTTTLQYILGKDKNVNLIRTTYFNNAEYWKKPFDNYKENLINIVSEETMVRQSGKHGKLMLMLYRISQCNPNAQIVVTVREQRAMLESRYKYSIPGNYKFRQTFDEWLCSAQGMDFLSLSMYSALYKTILSFFPAEQIHFIHFEELKEDQTAFLGKIYRILNLPLPEFASENIIKNKSLSDSELKAIYNFNKYKLFRKGSLAKMEDRFYLKLAKKHRNEIKIPEFTWGHTSLQKNIEKDFINSNKELISYGIFNAEKLKHFNYLFE